MGNRLSLDGWTSAQVQSAVKESKISTIVCWHDCHAFDWAPCRIPLKKDPRHAVYYSSGVFCSWSCAKAYCMQMQRGGTGKGDISLIAIVANKARRMHTGNEKGTHNAVWLVNVPPRDKLRLFGGTMDIEQFRKGCLRYDGTFIGLEDGSPPPKEPSRTGLKPAAFIDESIVSLVRCTTEHGTPQTAKAQHEFNCGNLRPSQYSRYKPSDYSLRLKLEARRKIPTIRNQHTLDSTMGVTVTQVTSVTGQKRKTK